MTGTGVGDGSGATVGEEAGNASVTGATVGVTVASDAEGVQEESNNTKSNKQNFAERTVIPFDGRYKRARR